MMHVFEAEIFFIFILYILVRPSLTNPAFRLSL